MYPYSNEEGTGKPSALENALEKHERSLFKIGWALKVIRDHESNLSVSPEVFEDYCRERWGLSKDLAQQFIQAFEVQMLIPQRRDLKFNQAVELARLTHFHSTNGFAHSRLNEQAILQVAARYNFLETSIEQITNAVDDLLADKTSAGNQRPFLAPIPIRREEVTQTLQSLLLGRSLHLCPGESQIGDIRMELTIDANDTLSGLARLPFSDRAFKTVVCTHSSSYSDSCLREMYVEIARVAQSRIIIQAGHVPVDKDGNFIMSMAFRLTSILFVQSPSHSNLPKLISVFSF